MSIGIALSNALSGLAVSGRRAEIVSSNVANATTEGYGTRRLETAVRVLDGQGAGVRATGVSRQGDPVLLGQRRDADAALGDAETRAGFLTRIETLLGVPGAPGSLTGQVDALEEQLVVAISRPDSPARLDGVLQAAQGLAGRLNGLTGDVQQVRLEADQRIGAAIGHLNTTLGALETLNSQIRSAGGGGRDVGAFLDQQQVLVDGISDLLPLRATRDRFGQLTLLSADGLSLLDGSAARFGFDATQVMAPDLSRNDATLSGITMNGRALTLDGGFPLLQGGRLGALLTVRDEIGVAAQDRLDTLAADLAARLDEPATDPTRAPTAPGLFTDGGQLVGSNPNTGLAGRLRVNALADPAAGGALWRLRDGIGAVAEGPAGNGTGLQAMLDALQAPRPTAGSVFSGADRAFSALAAEALSLTATDRQGADGALSFAAARHGALHDAELRGGVDTDHEMQMLLVIEQAYAANARVVQTIEDMLDSVMRI